ncbi:DUF1259 domain-containing protein [Streptomyces montanisoli]|uniref:DUF1259 domain-containing protein n=1 Tax=Streptomyces montanisoli TaxID=2798581 RepID=A0A940MCH8_9ACTN|nr:DUF1259 domain-containing protein [Streptomyces montanisoli]MBP0458749.1 DUF1259 domain-containing protein [Streptomyces montanisoli]
MADDRQQDPRSRFIPSRRRVLTVAALAPVLTGVPAEAGALPTAPPRSTAVRPVTTRLAEWEDVRDALGRPGDMKRFMYHTPFPRRDLAVQSQGVRITPELALGTHVSFVRYADRSTLLMGDTVVTEPELQGFIDALLRHGIMPTAIHKHLLAHSPQVWWVHVHAHGNDPVAVARGLRAAFDGTGTPPAEPATATAPAAVDLDTAAIDTALGVKGYADAEVYKCVFVRRETITDGHVVLPPGLGATTSANFQPLGGGRAALSADLAMIASEVQPVLVALRQGGIELVELHHHNLTDEPRLFFLHVWAVGDAVKLAAALHRAVDTTNVAPMAAGVVGS